IKVNEGKDEVDFVQNINPIGDKKEATGVVTRFKVFGEADADRYNSKLPVIVKLLAPSNIATILCDSYHKDILDYQTYSDQELTDFSKEILDKYKNAPDTGNNAFTEDDVLEIKYYLSNFVTETQSIRRSGYFENLALVIRKIPVSDWTNVLSVLWHRNEIVSNMFTRMIGVLQKLQFADEIYTDIETVRHYGNNINTIMSVDCLNGLDNPNWDKTAVVYLRSDNDYTAIPNVSKCELAAVCAETVYKIEDVYAHDKMKYGIVENPNLENGDMPTESVRELKHSDIEKSLLKNSDLLDFPGARNRLKVKESFLDKKDDTGVSNSVQMLLRGKVAHLFNSYSDSRIVNILLFCHDAEAIVVNDMYIMVNDWVERYVGKTAADRKKTIESYGNMSPLFNICTKFNIDMTEDEHPEKNNEAALTQRWYGRLIKVLYTQAFKANDVDWFKNWDDVDRPFKNSYLLRDYKYSGCTGSGNNLYDGYKETDDSPSEEKLELHYDFYKLMRQTFIQSKDVQTFFENPRLAWDVAATRNNDGSLYIIDRLCMVAANAANARAKQFNDEVSAISNSVLQIMKEYFISTDVDELLENNIRKAKSIFREMDFTCNSDNYYFGHLIQALQLTEKDCYKV
ncbi:MAG: virulence factor SrfC family protein, partial [Bacteroidaceae bacterium]